MLQTCPRQRNNSLLAVVQFSSCWDSEAWFLLLCGSSSILKILPSDAWSFLKWQKPFLVCFQRMVILTNKMTKGQPSYRGTQAIQAKINLIKRYRSELREHFCVSYCCIYNNLQGEQGRPAVSYGFTTAVSLVRIVLWLLTGGAVNYFSNSVCKLLLLCIHRLHEMQVEDYSDVKWEELTDIIG